MHERLSGGSGENVASEHIGNSVSDLRVDQPEWLSDERTKTLTDLSGGYLRYMQVSAFDGGEDWSNYGREILTTSKEVVGSYLSFLFSINMSFSDSSGHGTPVTDSWIYENKEIQKLGRLLWLESWSIEHVIPRRNIHSVTCENRHHSYIAVAGPAWLQSMLAKAEMLDTRAQ
ncbi:hypothetical protein HID58_082075 [Brassica napus]|uniref:Uncharacterized protein n=1 Tax=Brassica napus TaxID=3708 RepID=A0ABQ7Y9K0_BRANA|nr:hypothetical protein HID58_082075 [Brassica napus]